MNRHSMDIYALLETQQRERGNSKYNNYLFFIIGEKEERTYDKNKQYIEEVYYLDETHVILNL